MRRIWSLLILLIVVPGIACSQQPSGPTAQQEASPPAREEGYSQPMEQESALQIAEGALSKVDTQKQLLWIKGKDGKEMQFSFNPETKVEGAGGTVEGLAKMSGSDLKVHYRTEGEIHTAVRIEVLPIKT